MNCVADLIKIAHLAIVIGLVASIFVNSCIIKELALTLLIFLLVQYAFGFKKCGLTQLEYVILGKDKYQQGFIYRLVNPVITVPEKYFYNGLFYFHILWIVILIYQIRKQRCGC